MNEIIIEAITCCKLIEFNYKGQYRVLEPYTFGLSTAGNEMLRAYQVDGDSNSSNELGWRLYSLGKIENIKILETTFEATRDGYNPNDSAMSQIYITAS